jgi:hypothetical protein
MQDSSGALCWKGGVLLRLLATFYAHCSRSDLAASLASSDGVLGLALEHAQLLAGVASGHAPDLVSAARAPVAPPVVGEAALAQPSD